LDKLDPRVSNGGSRPPPAPPPPIPRDQAGQGGLGPPQQTQQSQGYAGGPSAGQPRGVDPAVAAAPFRDYDVSGENLKMDNIKFHARRALDKLLAMLDAGAPPGADGTELAIGAGWHFLFQTPPGDVGSCTAEGIAGSYDRSLKWVTTFVRMCCEFIMHMYKYILGRAHIAKVGERDLNEFDMESFREAYEESLERLKTFVRDNHGIAMPDDFKHLTCAMLYEVANYNLYAVLHFFGLFLQEFLNGNEPDDDLQYFGKMVAEYTEDKYEVLRNEVTFTRRSMEAYEKSVAKFLDDHEQDRVSLENISNMMGSELGVCAIILQSSAYKPSTTQVERSVLEDSVEFQERMMNRIYVTSRDIYEDFEKHVQAENFTGIAETKSMLDFLESFLPWATHSGRVKDTLSERDDVLTDVLTKFRKESLVTFDVAFLVNILESIESQKLILGLVLIIEGYLKIIHPSFERAKLVYQTIVRFLPSIIAECGDNLKLVYIVLGCKITESLNSDDQGNIIPGMSADDVFGLLPPGMVPEGVPLPSKILGSGALIRNSTYDGTAIYYPPGMEQSTREVVNLFLDRETLYNRDVEVLDKIDYLKNLNKAFGDMELGSLYIPETPLGERMSILPKICLMLTGHMISQYQESLGIRQKMIEVEQSLEGYDKKIMDMTKENNALKSRRGGDPSETLQLRAHVKELTEYSERLLRRAEEDFAVAQKVREFYGEGYELLAPVKTFEESMEMESESMGASSSSSSSSSSSRSAPWQSVPIPRYQGAAGPTRQGQAVQSYQGAAWPTPQGQAGQSSVAWPTRQAQGGKDGWDYTDRSLFDENGVFIGDRKILYV